MEKIKNKRGWIYGIKNKVNGKLYIGQTVNYTKREYQHFNKETCPALRNAFEKYGINNFEMFVILTFKAINEEVLKQLLDWFECFYIKKFNTFNDGYNCTLGGDGRLGYQMGDEAKAKISSAQRAYKSQDWVKQKDRERMLGNKLSEEFKKPILRYNLEGILIKEYSCIGDAIQDISNEGNYTNNWRSIHSNIIRALADEANKQHCNKAYDCIWKYKVSDSYEVFIEPFRRKNEKPVYHYTKEGNLIEYYSTLREASSVTGLTIHALKYKSYNGDLRRKEGRVPRSDYWSRLSPEEYKCA